MHVLIIPQSFPSQLDQMSGIFFKDQAIALCASGVKVGVVNINLLSPGRLFGAIGHKLFCNEVISNNDGFGCIQAFYPNVYPSIVRVFYFKLMIRRLFAKYVNSYGMPDIVHAHCTYWPGVVAEELKRIYKIPYVVTEHSSSFLENKWRLWQIKKIKKSLQSASAVISVSPALEKCLKLRMDVERINIIPNIVDEVFFKGGESKSVRHFRVSSIANHTQNKSTDILIKSFGLVLKKFPNAELEIYGPGPELPNLKILVESMNLNGKIKFCGPVSRSGVANALLRSDILVVTSKYETFSLILAEAIASKVDVISTKSGGPEYIFDLLKIPSSHLVDHGDVNQLANSIIKLFEDEVKNEDRDRYSFSAKSIFGGEQIAKKLISIYSDVIKH